MTACWSQRSAADDSAGASVEEYLKLRREAVKASDAHFFENVPLDPRYADSKLVLADLERRLRSIVGSVDLSGFPQPGRINLEGLCAREVDCGLLDGIVYRDSSWDRELLVTTRGLMSGWLDDRKWEIGDPARAEDALRSPDLLSGAVAGNSAFWRYADLPVPNGPKSGVVASMLVQRAQDYGPWPPDRLLLTVVRGERVFILQSGTSVKIDTLTVCNAAAHRAFEAAAASGQTPQQVDGDGIFAAYRSCYGEHLRDIPGIDQVIRQARDLVLALPPG
jgi:hypothetical protein